MSSRVADGLCLTSVSFTPSVVRTVLRHLKPSLSVGVDGIPNLFLRKCATSLCIPLCHIFDTSFKSNRLPEEWLNALVVTIHKKGSTSDPNNYRPIFLLLPAVVLWRA